MLHRLSTRSVWVITLSAAGIMVVTMGVRQSLGLFVYPIHDDIGLNIAAISLALAIGQFVWGLIQPIAGAVADRYGPDKILIGGLMLLAIGCGITPFMTSAFGFTVSLGILVAMGAGAGSFSVLIGAAAQRVPTQDRGVASGIINAGGSLGQFVFAPLLQKLIQSFGWAGAMFSLAALTMTVLPLVRKVAPSADISAPYTTDSQTSLRSVLEEALSNPSYWLLHAGFFTCGFHIAFLVTHLPGEVNLCGFPPTVASWSLAIIGLANILGSLYAGMAITRYRGKYVLAVMYGSRSVLIALYLLAPKTVLTFYLFAAGLGFTWLATVPPTASIVGQLFGVRHLSTLFGLTLLSHQIGGFFGAWLGGLAITRFGNFQWMWYADIALATLAAAANLPIREPPPRIAHASA